MLSKLVIKNEITICQSSDTTFYEKIRLPRANFIVAPDLRDGRPPEKAEPKIAYVSTAFVLRVACRPGGPAPL